MENKKVMYVLKVGEITPDNKVKSMYEVGRYLTEKEYENAKDEEIAQLCAEYNLTQSGTARLVDDKGIDKMYITCLVTTFPEECILDDNMETTIEHTEIKISERAMRVFAIEDVKPCVYCQTYVHPYETKYSKIRGDVICQKCIEDLSICANCNSRITSDEVDLYLPRTMSCDYYCSDCVEKGEYPEGCVADLIEDDE